MENLSKKDISFRLSNIKEKANEINNKIDESNKKNENRYNFAKQLGVRIDEINKVSSEAKAGLEKYVEKVDNILKKYDDELIADEDNEEYKLLNNMLYLDDIKLKNIGELLNENNELTTREYINLIANKGNDLIRQEELKSIDKNIVKYSKSNIIEKITGKQKMKKALVENYNLKRMEVLNRKYVPENKSLYEVVNIVNNCGYKSDDINNFVESILNEFNLDKVDTSALIDPESEIKLPFFYNKELIQKLSMQNADMLERINNKKKETKKTSEYEMYSDMLLNDVSTLELLNFGTSEVN